MDSDMTFSGSIFIIGLALGALIIGTEVDSINGKAAIRAHVAHWAFDAETGEKKFVYDSPAQGK